MNTSNAYEEDDATAALILQLQLTDIDDVLGARKGKGKEEQDSDTDIAYELYQRELQEQHGALTDRSLGQSLARTESHDADLNSRSSSPASCPLSRSIASGEGAMPARRWARFLPFTAVSSWAGGVFKNAAGLYTSSENEMHDDMVDDEDQEGPESSAWAASRRKIPSTEKGQCTCCASWKPVTNVYQAPCGHGYCKDCLITLFQSSTIDEALFPPRCCRQVMPLPLVRQYLDSTLVQAFEQKAVEYRTSDRTYCSQSTCSAFISVENFVNESGTCTMCGFLTCTICKANAHAGDCPQDTAMQQVLEVGKEAGWQRCQTCRRLVELTIGCYHMTYVSFPPDIVVHTS